MKRLLKALFPVAGLVALLMLLVMLPAMASSSNALPDTPSAVESPPSPALPNGLCATTADCVAETDLYIFKSIQSGVAAPGAEIEYKIQIQNVGDTTARNVVVSDILPANATYVSDDNTDGFTTASTGSTVVWTRPAMNPGETLNLYLRVRLSDTVAPGDPLENVARVTTSDVDVNPANDVYTDTNSVSADMDISKFAYGSSSESPRGEEQVYYLYFDHSSGSLDAADVAISDTLPLNTTFVGWSSDGNVDAPNHQLLGRTITPTVNDGQVVWDLGTVGGADYGYIYVVVQVSDTLQVNDTLTNVARVASSIDTQASNDVSTQTTTVATPTWDLVVFKSLWSGNLVPGTDVEYQLFVYNDGNAPARDVLITDTLPVSTTFVSWSSSSSRNSHQILGREVTETVVGNQVTWRIDVLRPGQYVYIYPIVHISETAPLGTVLTNTAVITSPHPDSGSTNNIDIDVATVATPTRDLYVTKYLDDGSGVAGTVVQYRIYFYNNGTATASDVFITDTLPVSTTYAFWSAYSSSENYTILGREITAAVDGNQIVWAIGDVGPSEYDYIYLTVYVSDTVLIGTDLDNVVRIATSDVGETSYSNNIFTRSLTVPAPAWDVEIDYKQLSYSSDDPLAGGEIKYQIKFRNNGNVPASNVIVTDDLPSNVEYISWSGSTYNPSIDLDETITWTVDGDQIVWYLGTLETGQYGYIHPTVHVTDTAEVRDVICNRARIWADVDGDPSNDVYTHTTSVYTPTYDMGVAKTVVNLVGTVGGDMVYEINVRNDGNATATGIAITETLPANTSFVSWSSSSYSQDHILFGQDVEASVNGGQIVWRVDEAPGDDYDTIYLTARVADTASVGDPMTNTVHVSTESDDWDQTDNLAVWTGTVAPPLVDIRVSKYSSCDGAPGGGIGYSISMNNYGNIAATDVVVTDTLPPNTSFMGWYGYSNDPYIDLDETIAPTVDGNLVVWHIDVMSMGQSIRLYPFLHISDTYKVGDELVNQVEVTSSDDEYNWENNSASETTTLVSTEIDAAVDKSSHGSPIPSGSLSYWINFSNNGNTSLSGVQLTETLPLSVTVEDWSSDVWWSSTNLNETITPTIVGNLVVWDLGEIPACSSGHIDLNVNISDMAQAGSVLTNVVEISAIGDSDLANNVYMMTTTVESTVPVTDVVISGVTDSTAYASDTFTATVTPTNATKYLDYEWWTSDGHSRHTYDSNYVENVVTFTWATTGMHTVAVTVTNPGGMVTDNHSVTVAEGVCDPITSVGVSGPASGDVDTPYTFAAVVAPPDASLPILYTWSPPPDSGQGYASAIYSWASDGDKTVSVTAKNCGGEVFSDTRTITIQPAPVCVDLTGVQIAGLTAGYVDTPYVFHSVLVPPNATPPIVYTWAANPPGDLLTPGQPQAQYTWSEAGIKHVTLTAENCVDAQVNGSHDITLVDTNPVSVTVGPGISGTLIYTDPHGMTTTIEIPAGAVGADTEIRFTPIPLPTEPISAGLRFGNHAFDLDAYLGGTLLPDFTFTGTVTVTVRYHDEDVVDMEEETLALYRYRTPQWVKIGQGPPPGEGQELNVDDNVLRAWLRGLSRFGQFGAEMDDLPIYLPLVLRNHQ